MKTLINPSLTPFQNPRILPNLRSPAHSPPPIRPSRSPILKCSSEEIENGGLKDLLSGVVDERVRELLKREENRKLLDGLEKASMRVELAKRELEEIERQEIEAARMRDYVDQLETRASEIAECQREIYEARAMVEEAECSLSLIPDGLDHLVEKENDEIDKDEGATSSEQLILPLAITFVSCALFGVTFRYTIRRDLDNIQLKSGTSAAFGIVKGLAALGAGPPLELNNASLWSHLVDGATLMSENLFVFLFAAVALDYCFKMRLLSPFPIKR
ncbi:hypothetical protein Syun_019853 [Stephania yunnanensis]|uniref:Uncharacterized protein n=1 Tax=Stephania yunnanensis TaxID=152371 RepID=A0AAP0IX96_9MAGN